MVTEREYELAQAVIREYNEQRMANLVIPLEVHYMLNGYTENGKFLPNGSRVDLIRSLRLHFGRDAYSLGELKDYVFKYCNEKGL